MLAEERLRKILQILQKKNSVTLSELTDTLNISEATIRRDLTELDNQGLLIKVRGGAVSNKGAYSTRDEEVAVRQTVNLTEKNKIAEFAAALLKQGDFVYIDAGTTTELMIDYITQKDVSFVTNAIGHAKKLTQKGYKVYILGGQFKLSTEAIVGAEAIESLKKYNFTKGFWGVNGLNPVNGYTTPEVSEASIKKESMKHCKETFILADQSKFSQISSVTFAEFTSAAIITNGASEKLLKEYDNIIVV
ncbi:MAG: DeoR/GlpR family DNA-binding transcription regulator [Eubacteriales bacterium]|nr:DeoR/GlpR family DNA-binding transcription regulator [Eubacteriales bacterium]